MKFTISKDDFGIKLNGIEIIYWCLNVFAVIFIFNEAFLSVFRVQLILGILCAFIILLEKLLWRFFRKSKDEEYFEIKNNILKIINSFVILGKYVFPIVAYSIGLMRITVITDFNIEDYFVNFIFMISLMFYSNLMFQKFIKQNPYD